MAQTIDNMIVSRIYGRQRGWVFTPYAERLIAEYGEQTIAELRVRSEQVKKFTITELEEIIAKYKSLLSEIGEGKNV